MANSLVYIEMHDLSVGPAVTAREGLDVSNSGETPEHLRNISGELAKREDGRLNQFLVRMEVTLIVGIANQAGGQQVSLGWQR